MLTKDHPLLRFVSFAVLFFFIANLVFLDYIIFNNRPRQNLYQTVRDQTRLFQIESTDEIHDTSRVCNEKDCLEKIYQTIYEATASLRLANPSTTPSQETASQSSASRESIITFGSGSSIADDWTDVTGLQAYVDTAQYSRIKNVVFEASVFIPTGNEVAYVRLFNKTDKHPVWFSEVSLEGGQPQLLISQPVTLDSGNKLYQVQMKTSLKFQANLVQSRLRITTY